MTTAIATATCNTLIDGATYYSGDETVTEKSVCGKAANRTIDPSLYTTPPADEDKRLFCPSCAARYSEWNPGELVRL